MDERTWEAVDTYFMEQLGAGGDEADAVLRASVAAGLPGINVSPAQGKLLHLLARAQSAEAILEIGTLGGYSTWWLARALPEHGRLISLELNPGHADVARDNLARAGLGQRVQIRVGPALDLLPGVLADDSGPFDLVFIDADKPGNPDYFAWALRLARPGSTIVVDNVVRRGAVLAADSTDPAVLGVRRLVALVAAEPRVSATVLQTVGVKGYDGLLVAHVLA